MFPVLDLVAQMHMAAYQLAYAKYTKSPTPELRETMTDALDVYCDRLEELKASGFFEMEPDS